MRRLLILLAFLSTASMLAQAGAAFAAELQPPPDPDAAVALPDAWVDCGYFDVDATGDAMCVEEPFGVTGAFASPASSTGAATLDSAAATSEGLPANCRLRNEVIFWTAANWARIAEILADNPAPCTAYYVSIPPAATPKTTLLRGQAARIRALGPQFHAVADMFLHGPTGWARWVRDNRPRFSSDAEAWYEAGVEFRRRMAGVGFDVTQGDSWLVNDFNTGTRRDGGSYAGLDLDAWKRSNMRALVRGLYEGPADGTLGRTRGAAQVAIQFTHQDIPFIEEYKADWKNWLLDDAFWADMDRYVRWLGKEVYADSRYWGEPGTSRNERSRHLQQYLFHVVELAEAAPPDAARARDYLRTAYVPLANATWTAVGPNPCPRFATVVACGNYVPPWCCGHGETFIPLSDMFRFVTEEIFAIRHYAGSHPQGAPAGRLGFTWQPTNNFNLPRPQFLAAQDALMERIASAIRYGYRQGGASPAGVCSPPGSEEYWCDGGRVGSSFTEAWETFGSWDP